MAVTLNKANLVLKDANGNIGKIEQLSDRDLAKIRTAVSDVALVVNQSNHTPIEATTTNKGVVQLATSADVVAGASDKVVTAEQLHNSTTGTSALATENLARIDAVVTEAGISIDHTNTNQLKDAVTTLVSSASAATATSTTLGVVKPDNDTITIDSNGVLTATAQMPGVATTTNVGVVKPDGTTITVDGDGTLTCGGKNLVRSVNSITPDASGNVLLGTEKSTFNKVVYDTGYFSITTNKGYSFDLTGTDLENVSKENVNIKLVAKVTTAHNGFEVGDIAQLTPTIDYGADVELDICSYIRGNTLYVYSGNNSSLSIRNERDWLKKANVQIKAVLTAFIPDDGSILLIAEDQTNTSKLIGLPDGTLTWGGKNLVTSVNGNKADSKGNVSNALDYSNKIDFAGNSITYTCPSDGWIFMSGIPATTNGHVYVNDVIVNITHHIAGQTYTNGVNVQMIVNKGDIVKTDFVTTGPGNLLYYFVPFKGV